jgi:hypothetical protein
MNGRQVVALVKVRTSGEVLPVSISEFKPAELASQMTDNTEAIIMKNTETLGVYMTATHRNKLANDLDNALFLVDMMAAGRSWEDVKRSARQARERQGLPIAEARKRARAEKKS